MAIVTGNNVSLKIYDNGAYRLYACAMSCELSISTGTIETSVTGSGTWASFKPQKHSWSGSFSGVVNLDVDGQLTIYSLRALQIAMTLLVIQFTYLDQDGNEYNVNGSGYIVNSSSSGEENNISTFNIELQGSGALVQVLTPVPGKILAEDGSFILAETGDYILIQ